MNINFTGQNFHISEELKTLTSDKFNKVIRHSEHITHAHIIFRIDNENTGHIAEATIHVRGCGEIFAKASSGDMYKSVDEMIAKLDRQVKKHKEKITNHYADKRSHVPE